MYKSVVVKNFPFKEYVGFSPFSVLVLPHYRNSFRRARAFCRAYIHGQHEHHINRLSRSSRGTRGRPVIGSQPHPARPVSAQQDTRKFIRRPSLLFLPHTYRKHSASLTYPTYPAEIVSSQTRTGSDLAHRT